MSGIAASCGTNRNEGFHRYIRTFFHKSRIGTLLAYAIASALIHINMRYLGILLGLYSIAHKPALHVYIQVTQSVLNPLFTNEAISVGAL